MIALFVPDRASAHTFDACTVINHAYVRDCAALLHHSLVH